MPQRDLRIQFSDRVSLSSSFIHWLDKITEPAPEQRFTTASQALDALKSGIILNRSTISQQLQASVPLNNSGCGLFNASQKVPDEIKGWNWGEFIMPWFWAPANLKWIGLLAWILFYFVGYGLIGPVGWYTRLGLLITISIALGTKGNEWAWKSRRWRGIEHFKAHQRGWAIATVLVGTPFSIMLWMTTISTVIRHRLLL